MTYESVIPPWEDDKTYPALIGGKVVEVSGADIKRGSMPPWFNQKNQDYDLRHTPEMQRRTEEWFNDPANLRERIDALEETVAKLTKVVKLLATPRP